MGIRIASYGLHKPSRGRLLKCQRCGARCSNHRTLDAHYRRDHKKSLRCSKCAKVCNTPSSLAHHKYFHLPIQHQCNDCPAKFRFKSEFTTHRISHAAKGYNQCQFGKCGNIFKHPNSLLRHIRTHKYTKTLKCRHCSYTTKDPRYLGIHMRKHLDPKYECQRCKVKFYHPESFKRHVATNKCRAPSPEY